MRQPAARFPTSGNRVDPWGNPYQYLNYDPAGEVEEGGSESGKGKGSGGGSGKEKKDDSECSSNSDGGGKEKIRKDRFLHPLNTDYDLYSMGPDGQSQAPLTAAASRDDIIRARNGNFFGQAGDFF